jgi:hypothetical protein
VNLASGIGIDVQTMMTGRGCVIGQSGSGKSFLAGVIAEELCKLNMPFCVVDTEGEYSSLKTAFDVIVVGGENKDVEVDIDYSKLFSESIANDIPVVLDFSDVVDRKELVYKALQALYDLEDKIRKPYLVFIEEADKFAPQVLSKNSNIIEEISVRGRKRGVGLLLTTQRPANISKNVLSQCSYGFIGKLTIDNDLSAIKILFEDRDKLVSVTRLKVGEFLPFGLKNDKEFLVKKRTVRHMGMTPLIDTEKPISGKLRGIIKGLKAADKVSASKKSDGGEIIPIETLLASFSRDNVNKYAERIARKQFIVFGSATERTDSIRLKYLPLGLCNFRIPTSKKNEYMEYWTIVDDRGNLVRLDKRVKFLVEEDTEKASKNRYKYYLKKEPVVLEKADVGKADIIKSNINEKKARSFISRLFPTSTMVDFKIIHLPVYKITLKKDNKVRVFNLDALYGKELNLTENL